MKSVEMLDIRNRIRKALIEEGFDFSGGGVNMTEPEADLDMSLGQDDFHITIKWRGASGKGKSEDKAATTKEGGKPGWEPWQEGVFQERADLSERHGKLLAFMATDTFRKLHPRDVDLLIRQSREQHILLVTLTERIFNFKKNYR